MEEQQRLQVMSALARDLEGSVQPLLPVGAQELNAQQVKHEAGEEDDEGVGEGAAKKLKLCGSDEAGGEERRAVVLCGTCATHPAKYKCPGCGHRR